MIGLDARVDALCSSPTGCAFLLVVEENGVAPEGAARPVVAINIAGAALVETEIWRDQHDAVVNAALQNGSRLKGLARAILSQPAAAWWFAPLDRTAQWVIMRPDDLADPAAVRTPTSPPTNWERYAQKPEGAVYSSTAVDGTCAVLAAMETAAADYYQVSPIGRVAVRPRAIARVYEVAGPLAWHKLAARYPALDEAGRLVPDWGLVSADWDGVHITLGGCLTSDQVRITSANGWTEFRGWPPELTVWLRACFAEAVRLPDLLETPAAPVPLDPPRALHLFDPDAPGNWWVRIRP
jgi:hypothetical protein